MFSARLFTSTVLVSLVAGTALAQTAIVPPTVDPGRIPQRFERNQRPEVTGKPIIQGLDQQQVPQQNLDNTTSFTLTTVNIEGNTVISDAAMQKHYQHLVGKYVNLGSMQQVAQRITAQYREAGYVLSRAVVPAQRVSGGAVTIQIVEGYVSNVKFQGDVPSTRNLEGYANEIKKSRPLRVQDLERGLLLMDDLSGMVARGTLVASPSTPGASDLVVNLEHIPIQGGVSVNNRGSRFLGPLQGEVLAQENGQLGLDEQISLRTIQALNLSELNFYEGAFEAPIGQLGTRARITGSWTETEPGNFLEQFDLEGENRTFVGRVDHPFMRTRRENLFGTAGFTYRDSNFDTFGVELYDDNIRTVDAGLSYDFYDDVLGRNGINQMSLGVTQGLDVWSANEDDDLKSRANADPTFTKLNYDVQRLQDLGSDFALRVSSTGQYAFQELYASEEFALGSLPYGSAYDPAEISGDHGIAARAELQYLDFLNADYLYNSQLYTFFDAGKVWNDDALLGEEQVASLTSTGVGVRAELLDFLEAGVELSVPLTRNVSAENSKAPRVFFNVGYSFP